MYNDMSPLRYTIIQNSFIDLIILYLYSSLPASQPLATTDPFIVSIVLSFSGCRIIGIVQHDVSSHWLLLLSNMHLRLFMSFYG